MSLIDDILIPLLKRDFFISGGKAPAEGADETQIKFFLNDQGIAFREDQRIHRRKSAGNIGLQIVQMKRR